MKYKSIIKKGSKSFSMASLFFSSKQKIATWKLYSWCRYCDDEVDETADSSIAALKLKGIINETSKLLSHDPSNFYYSGLKDVVEEFQIPIKYPLDLLRGMEMDTRGGYISDFQELEEYCYCVAGTVGLMMCHIIGIRDEVALKHAVALGKAMQLTNIARDLKQDHEKKRLYIPLSWLAEKGILKEEIFLEKNRESLLLFQERLLHLADAFYKEGLEGLRYLSTRSSLAILIASKVYSEIGNIIRKDPERSLRERIFVTKGRKLQLVFKSLLSIFPLAFIHRKQKRVCIPVTIWSIN